MLLLVSSENVRFHAGVNSLKRRDGDTMQGSGFMKNVIIKYFSSVCC